MSDQNIDKFEDPSASAQPMTEEQRKHLMELVKQGKIAIEADKLDRMTVEQAQDIISRFSVHPKKVTQDTESKNSTQMEKKDEFDENYQRQQATVEFDLMDEGQIIEMLEGRANRKYIYSFQAGGKTVEGISYAGTIDAAKYYSEKMVEAGYKPLEITKYEMSETDDVFRCFVLVRDGKSGMVLPGYASQPKKMKVYTDREHVQFVMKDDEKADVKVVSKATRNGYRNIMPAPYVDAYIAMVKNGLRK